LVPNQNGSEFQVFRAESGTSKNEFFHELEHATEKKLKREGNDGLHVGGLDSKSTKALWALWIWF
jgi:hypothetical protein